MSKRDGGVEEPWVRSLQKELYSTAPSYIRGSWSLGSRASHPISSQATVLHNVVTVPRTGSKISFSTNTALRCLPVPWPLRLKMLGV